MLKKNKTLHRLFSLGCLTGILVFSNGCVNLSPHNNKDKDGPPVFPRSVKNIPDALPKPEIKSKYGNPAFYQVAGKEYRVMESNKNFEQIGMASWYGRKFHGKRTSSGEPYDMYAMTAAHPSVPLPTYLEVTNLANGKSAIVKVNDRGPFVDDRILDLSYAAAHKLGIYQTGTGKVHIKTVLSPSQPLQFAKNTPALQPIKPLQLIKNTLQAIPTNKISPGVYLQLGAFNDRHNAEELALLAQRIHHTPPLIALTAQIQIHENIVQSGQDKSAKYRVRLGPLPAPDKSGTSDKIVEQLALKLKSPLNNPQLSKIKIS